MPDLRSAPIPPLRPNDHVRGPDDGPLVVLYGDFACTFCALAHQRLAAHPLRYVFRHFALRAKHPRSLALALASEAAARQAAFWPMHDALFADQGRLDDPHLWARAQHMGLDLDRFERDRRSPHTAARVSDDVRDGLRAGVTVTPTLFATGNAHPGPPDAAWIEALLRGGGNTMPEGLRGRPPGSG